MDSELEVDEFDIIEQWKRTGLLNGLSEQVMDHCAFLLENQRLYNLDDQLTPQFRRISVPLLRRVFEGLSNRVTTHCFLTETFSRFLETNISAEIDLSQITSGAEILDLEKEGVAKMAEQLVDVLADLAKAKKSKLFYLEGLGLENGKLVVFYEL